MTTSFDQDRSAYQPSHNNYSNPQGAGNSFSQPTSNTYPQQSGNPLSQSTNNTFSQHPSNTFSQQSGNTYSQSTGNASSNPSTNTFSQSTGQNYTQPPRPIDTSAGNSIQGLNTGGSGPTDDIGRRLDVALHSDQGVERLQARLRQSIYSARDFSNLLKERCALEDRYAQGCKKLVRNASESVRRPEARQGSFLHSFDETLRINDRLADNTLLFANGLHTMSEELREMADNADKGRKLWKHNTSDAEKRVAEAENALHKARERYNAAAEHYDRVRGGEKPSGKFGLKNKSPAQHEEALKEKADVLDQEYNSRRDAAQAQRYEFENSVRPQIVQALRDLIDESDAHLAMQLAKLASMSEKHMVSNGVAITPIKSGSASGPEPRGLRQLAQEIDNKKDFHDYILDGRENTVPFGGSRTPRQSETGQPFSPAQPVQSSSMPHGGQQSSFVAGAPQLPQIGGPDGFNSSFETPRPTPANQTSYIGDQSMNVITPSTTRATNDNEPNPYAPDTRPPFESNPSIPAFDRGLASSNGASTVPSSNDRSTGISGTTPSQPAGRGQATSNVIPGMYMGKGSGTPSGGSFPAGSVGQGTGRGQGLSDQASMPGTGRGPPPYTSDRTSGGGPNIGFGRDQQTTADNRTTGLPMPNTGYGRGQTSPLNDRSQGPPMPDTGYGRGQQSSKDRAQGIPMPNTDYGRGQTSTGPTQQSGFGRGQGADVAMGRGQPPLNQQSSLGRGQSPLNTNQQSNLGRGQSPLYNNQQPNLGRGQQSPYNDRAQGAGVGSDMPLGRGQSPTGPNKLTTMNSRDQQSPYSERGQGPTMVGGMGRGQSPTAGRGLPSQQFAQQSKPTLPPNKPVFGVHLDELFRRDGTAVPAIVFQCIQAVDIHGINTEGIYRVSGSSPTIAQLKSEFDHDSSIVDLKRPQLYNNDIASVATLLKNFLRDLPDPLLTEPAYASFIQAAKHDDLVMRRDALHQYINSLPDPNYATLRVLVLHLHRISTHSDVNKMDIKNLSIVFGPTVMGGSIVSDAGWQTKVMETILHHTFEIFDPDE